MTFEEVLSLEPGDKITYDTSKLLPIVALKIQLSLEKSNDYFVFEIFDGYSVFVKTLSDRKMSFSLIENIKLYEDSNRPWSYERDY